MSNVGAAEQATDQPFFDALPRLAWPALAGWSLLLVFAVYGGALRLPFFFDDLVQIPFALQNDFRAFWWPEAGAPYAYYRPLTLTLWKLAGQSATVQHLLNLLLHAGNGLLVGWLAGRLWQASSGPGWARPFFSATLYLLFPFSYQAIPFAGALTQILATTLILLALAAYVATRSSARRPLYLLSLLFAILAPFAHENGVLVGPLLGALLLTDRRRAGSGPIIRRAALWTLPALLWLPLWWLAPKGLDGGLTLNGPEAIVQNGLYFWQGAGVPLTWLGAHLREAGLNDLLAAGLLSAAALLAAAAVQWRAGATGNRRRSLLPWLWCALTMLPTVLVLPFDYVINGPRLLLLFSVGVAWLWADVIALLLAWARPSSVRTVLPLLFAALLLGQNLAYVRSRMQAHRLLGQVTNQAVALTREANDGGERAIFVNFPSWIAPPASYAVGHEGVLFWPDYVPPETLVNAQTGEEAQLRLVRQDAIRPQAPYDYGIAGSGVDWTALAEGGGRVFVARYGAEEIMLHSAGAFLQTPPAEAPLVHFEGDSGLVNLLEADVRSDERGLAVRLTWQVTRPPAADVTVFAHLVDAGGQLLAQVDGEPLGGAYALAGWPRGLVATDVRHFAAAPEGAELRVGLYRRGDGGRLQALSPSGQRLPGDAFSVTIP